MRVAKQLTVLFSVLVITFGSPAVASALPNTTPEKVGVSKDRLERLDRVFQSYVDNEDMAGSVIMALRNGQVFYKKAFGYQDKEAKTAMRTDSMFRIASQTKAIVSVATMVLQEQGLLHINQPVSQFIPEFAKTQVIRTQDDGSHVIEQASRQITIRDLLTHTSGVAYGNGTASDYWAKAGIQGWYFADRNETMLDVVRRMADLPFEANPREKWIYGYNTDILGAVLEVASGKSLDQLLSELIFVPLQMQDTHFYLPESKVDRLAVVYTPLPEGGIIRSPAKGTMDAQGHYVKGPRKAFSGGAGLVSTADDYASFLQMLANGGRLGEIRILSRKSVELMTVDHLGAISYKEGSGFGLGFRIIKEPGLNGDMLSKGVYRWGGAYHSTYWVDPSEQLVVVYFTQLRPKTKVDDHQKLRALIYQAIDD